MSNWSDFQREERARLAPGDYRVEIVGVEETTSKSSGKPMLVISVRPNGSTITIKHYIVKNEYFNRNMTEFFDSFNIDEADFTLPTWVGAVGAARLKEDKDGYLKVHWFISAEKAYDLPEWQGEFPKRQEMTKFEELEDDGELPWEN